MTRSWIKKAVIAFGVLAVVCPIVHAAEDDNGILAGPERGPYRAQKLVINRHNTNFIAPPQLPDDPWIPKEIASSVPGKLTSPIAPGGATVAVPQLGGGVGLIAASPEIKLEHSLKDIAQTLR